MSLPRYLFNAVFRPAKTQRPAKLIRSILCWPILFDLVSFALQLRDFGRLRGIRDSYGADDSHHRKVQDYNAGVSQGKVITTTRRAEIIYQAIALPSRDTSAERLLIIGPRNVQELFIAWLYGFIWENMEAIDLYSTNPKIQVMNMEAMSFSANQFDAVTMSATLAYAEDTEAVLSEVARVLKPGGRFAFNAVYDPGSLEWPANHIHGATIVDILGKLGLHVYYCDTFDKTNSRGRRQSSHCIAVQKEVPGDAPLDPLRVFRSG